MAAGALQPPLLGFKLTISIVVLPRQWQNSCQSKQIQCAVVIIIHSKKEA
jgi:hypothetical protein